MSWICSQCDSEWDPMWQFFYLTKKKYCIACETELTDDQRELGEFKRMKQPEPEPEPEPEPLTCPCNNKTYASLSKLKLHQKTKGHVKWSNDN